MKTTRSVRAALSSAAPHATRTATRSLAGSRAAAAERDRGRGAAFAEELVAALGRHWRPVIFVVLARMCRGEDHPADILGGLVFSALWLAATFVLIKPNADGQPGGSWMRPRKQASILFTTSSKPSKSAGLTI